MSRPLDFVATSGLANPFNEWCAGRRFFIVPSHARCSRQRACAQMRRKPSRACLRPGRAAVQLPSGACRHGLQALRAIVTTPPDPCVSLRPGSASMRAGCAA